MQKKDKHFLFDDEENETCGLGCFSNEWFCKLEYVLHVIPECTS